MLRKLRLDYADKLDEGEVAAFADMESRLGMTSVSCLSDRQRQWVRSVLDRFEPSYENLASSGLVSKETKVPTLDLLKPENLPKRPPGRR